MSSGLKPIQLITFGTDKKLQVNSEAIAWLTSPEVSQSKHLGVITVVGKYRTGKSYILNRVLLGQNSGFEVGPTINACTKGLWVWPKLIQSPEDPSLQFLVMDTEGLGSLEEGEQTDTKIFLMALLLSSYFIYNSQGSIDEKAVQSLSLVINLSKLLQKGGQRQMSDILSCFPSFLWLVRDFALKLVDEQGIKISPKQYLDNALKMQSGNSEMMIRKNAVRKQMLNFFRDRDCFMLIRPVDDEKKLQNMSKLKDNQLRPQFLELIKDLQNKIFKAGKKKTFKGKPCSPSMFIDLCQHFCTSINQGGLPDIESNWELVCKAEVARVEKKCIGQFEQLMKSYAKMDARKVDLKTFQTDVTQKISQVLKYFEKNTFGNKDQKRRALRQRLEGLVAEVKSRISQEKNQQMEDLFTQAVQKLERKVHDNKVTDIFQITGQYDQIVNNEIKTANNQTLAFLYKRAYEGLRSTTVTYFGATHQTHKHENSLLSQKLNIYQNSLNRIQGQNSKKNIESEKRQRQLRQNVFHLEAKVQQSIKQLDRARKELQKVQNINQGDKENSPMTC